MIWVFFLAILGILLQRNGLGSAAFPGLHTSVSNAACQEINTAFGQRSLKAWFYLTGSGILSRLLCIFSTLLPLKALWKEFKQLSHVVTLLECLKLLELRM